ncbi:Gp15 family bacteriophage protein [Listeria rocourtiae]|nr:Gp15 family bacteriophage protein [Listeria rocourtiae]
MEDAQYIFSSFKHYYDIDLFEVQGELDWRKFKAYLSDLGSKTKFKEVMEIRMMKIPKDATEEEKENIKQLKKLYQLKADHGDIENDAMDLAERQALLKKQMAEAEGKEVE